MKPWGTKRAAEGLAALVGLLLVGGEGVALKGELLEPDLLKLLKLARLRDGKLVGGLQDLVPASGAPRERLKLREPGALV